MLASADVVIVGGGNAGLSAALAAREAGADVLVLEKAPLEWAGGNSYFTAGAYRLTFESLEDLRALVELPDEVAVRIDVPRYSKEDFQRDMDRVTLGRTDPELSRILAEETTSTAAWLRSKGVEWELLFARQSFEVDGRVRFWGNLVLGARDGGRGLIEAELAAVAAAGIEMQFDAPVSELRMDDDRITGVDYRTPDGPKAVVARAVVIASGGFEASARHRASYLGPGWDLAKVRGTPYNTGEVLFRALDAGADPRGHWSGCHAIAWDAAAPNHGDRGVSNRYSRQAYPFGLVINRNGHRFLDEGADFRNYTYAKYGAEILHQPGALAFQLFDAATLPYVAQVDYSTARTSRFEASTLPELADRIGVPRASLVGTIETFNDAVQPHAFDPSSKDGKGTVGVHPPKSNWAQPLLNPPFVAFAVTCGITFTFGGVAIDRDGRVLRVDGQPLDGLFACGEVTGGLFYHNYPGGSGLAAGSVFGRRAGRSAAEHARLAPAGSMR